MNVRIYQSHYSSGARLASETFKDVDGVRFLKPTIDVLAIRTDEKKYDSDIDMVVSIQTESDVIHPMQVKITGYNGSRIVRVG